MADLVVWSSALTEPVVSSPYQHHRYQLPIAIQHRQLQHQLGVRAPTAINGFGLAGNYFITLCVSVILKVGMHIILIATCILSHSLPSA